MASHSFKINNCYIYYCYSYFIFVLIQGILPVPERVPYNNVTSKLNSNSNLKVDWLYTEISNKNNNIIDNEFYNYINPEMHVAFL